MNFIKFDDRFFREQERMLSETDSIQRAKLGLSFEPGVYRKKLNLGRVAIFGSMAAAAVAAVVLGFLAAHPAPPPTLTASLNGKQIGVGDWILGAAVGERKLSFSDGSAVALAKNAGMRVQSFGDNGAGLLLEHGNIYVRITHRENTRWKLLVGPFVIDVRGTCFSVGWSPETQSFQLDLHEGAVDVSGPMPAAGRRMTEGESMRASLSDERIEIENVENVGDVPNLFTRQNEQVNKLGASPCDTCDTCDKQDEQDKQNEQGNKLGVLSHDEKKSAADLMLQGDTARRAGELDTAMRWYKAVLKRFPNTVHASGAAFSLGTIAFDQLQEYGAAAKWFEKSLRLKKSDSFSKEALGRLIEALERAGNNNGARREAERYLLKYPSGPHAALAHRILNGR